MARVLTAVLVTVLVAALTGCTGSAASTSAWADQSDKAMGQAVSSLGTAQVVLDTGRNRLTHAYAVGALADAVEVADKQVATYDELQPPDDLHQLAREVVSSLHDAVELLVAVRTAYSSPGLADDQASALRDRVGAELERLDTLATAVDGATG